MHSIYIKTEPAGRIAFGALSTTQIQQLIDSIDAGELLEELDSLRYNSFGDLEEAEGVVNSGEEGDFGNEGKIVFSEDQTRLGPEDNADGTGYEEGVYVVLMRLSKCSVEFEFDAEGGFDADEFEEVSVPVKLPIEIVHGLYGHPKFNVITGFRFRGETIEEYEGEIEDRGYDDQLTFFAIKDEKIIVICSNYNEELEWDDSKKCKHILEAFVTGG